MNVQVVIRVFDRIPDLEICLQTIARHWTRHEYRVLVVSNGAAAGYPLPPSVAESGAEVAVLEENRGHMAGSAQLLEAGRRRVADDCSHVVILEADTWLFSDRLVDRYLQRMARDGLAWAAAEWLERYYSVAVDFAIVDAAVLRDHPDIFAFERSPECHIANYLRHHGLRYTHIPELMPVHIPSAMRRFYNPAGGRFRSFVKGPMVTHHVEDLAGGLPEKMRLANHTLGRREFDVPDDEDPAAARRRLARLHRLARLVPRSAWFRAKRERAL